MLAALRGPSYLAAAAVVAAAACSRPAPLAPAGAFQPLSAEEFRAVAARTAPTASQLLTIRWRYDDGSSPVSGRGAVRLAPPDSLRLDIGLSVVGRATLVIAGDSTWVRPEAMAGQILPARAIVWALFGVVRPPDDDMRIEVSGAGDRRLYRLTSSSGVATTLELRGDTLLAATQVRGAKTIGRVVLTRDAGGALVRSVAMDREHGSEIVVNVDRREASGPFPAEIWRRP